MVAVTSFLLAIGMSINATSASAAAPCKKNCTADTTVPSVAIAAPAGGATVAGTITVSGSASDNVSVSRVDVAVDGTFNPATGTGAWSMGLDTRTYPNGSHTILARATDTSGNTSSKSMTVTVSNVAADTTAPAVSITAPVAGATVSGTTTVTGTASDNVALARVEVAVDAGAWQTASGTSSWTSTVQSSAFTAGSHSITARATDSSGNNSSTTVSVTVNNGDTQPPSISIGLPSAGASVQGGTYVRGSVSDNVSVARVDVQVDGGPWQPATGTSGWVYLLNTAAYADGPHTLTARATDSAGNSSSTAVGVNVNNGPTTATHMVTPEGTVIDINSAGPWTASGIYTLLKQSVLPDYYTKIGPTLTIKVADTGGSQTQAGAGTVDGIYRTYSAVITLQGVNSTFASQPDAVLAHEYGHAWTLYHLYLSQQGDWSSYLDARGLTGNPSLDSSYTWTRQEIIADDYRLLFGSSAAISERPTHLNPSITDPRNVPGLSSFFVNSWGIPKV